MVALPPRIWDSTERFRRSYPRVLLEPDRIYTHDDEVWTSAGISAGIDMALAARGGLSRSASGQKQPLRSTRSRIYSDWWVVWRTRHDSNVRPLPSEGSALSS